MYLHKMQLIGMLYAFYLLAKEAWLVHRIVDFYVESHSQDALDILFQVTEPHDKVTPPHNSTEFIPCAQVG